MAKRAIRSKRSSPKRKTKSPFIQLTPDQVCWIYGLFLVAIGMVTFLTFLTQNRGTVTEWWLNALRMALGWGAYLVPLACIFFGVWIVTLSTDQPLCVPGARLAGVLVVYFMGLGLVHQLMRQPEVALKVGRGGGYVGFWLSQGLDGALGWAGAFIVLLTMVVLGLSFAFDLSLTDLVSDSVELAKRVGAGLRRLWLALPRDGTSRRPMAEKRRQRKRDRQASESPSRQPRLPESSLPPRPSLDRPPSLEPPVPAGSQPVGPVIGAGGRRWIKPEVASVLSASQEAETSLADIREKTRIIEETLQSLGVPVTVVEVNPGPVVTQFGLEPGYVERRDRKGKTHRVKVKVSRISALANDLALALAAAPIRIEAPVPGKGIVGLEVPNRNPSNVDLRGVLDSPEFQAFEDTPLAVAMGRDVSGVGVVTDLARLPHLLIAGATGSGKSVCINALIATLLLRNSPDRLKVLMVDPKRVELSNYNGIPHLLAPVVVDPERVVGVLTYVAREMDRRYKVFARMGARNIQSYNEQAATRAESPMPYIVVFIDELADLMMVAPDAVEKLICRIAQMARATGIHLVVATQRPSVDVVTGLIKANFPARISFAVSSAIDSRVIIDTPGADKLLGSGDGLFMPPDSPKLMRIQGCWVSDEELDRIAAYWRDQATSGQGSRVDGISMGELVGGQGVEQRPLWTDMDTSVKPDPDEDPLMQDAIDLVAKTQRASVSFLQRRLRIGYTRASRLIDTMEQRGMIGPATGSSKARDVLIEPAPEDVQVE